MSVTTRHSPNKVAGAKLRRKIQRLKRDKGIYEEAISDEHHLYEYKEYMNEKDNVILGVYDVSAWLRAENLRSAFDHGKNTNCEEVNWVIPANWDFIEWVRSYTDKFNFVSKGRVFLHFDWGLAEATLNKENLYFEVTGDPEEIEKIIAKIDTQFKRAENMIQWIYNKNGDSIDVPLNYRPAISEAYPWLSKSLDDYIDDYLDSDASVLILIGPPGTGKTTFIKNLIHRSKGNALVSYDDAVMSGDSIFASFIGGDSRFLIMEDADTFLQARQDGNTMMHRFLNVSDGLISAANKKLVFSTNLPSVQSIDPALMRPGRCYDTIEFRPLNKAEAAPIAAKFGFELDDAKKDYTLAELFNNQPSHHITKNSMKKVGFY